MSLLLLYESIFPFPFPWSLWKTDSYSIISLQSPSLFRTSQWLSANNICSARTLLTSVLTSSLGPFSLSLVIMCVCLAIQLCLTLWDPMDCSLPGSPIYGILQARILEWSPCPPPGNLPNPGVEPRSPTLQVDSLLSEPPGKSLVIICQIIFTYCPSYFAKPLTHWCYPSKSVFLEKTREYFGIFHAVFPVFSTRYSPYHWKKCIGTMALQGLHSSFHWYGHGV